MPLLLKILQNVICPNTSCPIESILPNNPFSDGTYQAAETVISTGTVPAGRIVSQKAGQSISLEAGFSADLGADFEAIIETCQ